MTYSDETAGTRPDVLKGAGRYNAYLIILVIFVCFGSSSYGYTAAVIGTTLGQPSFITYMGLDTAKNAASLEGAITSLFYAGGVIGSFCHSWVANSYGRKKSIAVACVIMILSSALMTASVNIAMFITFRFFSGWAYVAKNFLVGGYLADGFVIQILPATCERPAVGYRDRTTRQPWYFDRHTCRDDQSRICYCRIYRSGILFLRQKHLVARAIGHLHGLSYTAA